MNTLIAKVRKQNLFKEGETVVVAVSGGADSVALLDILVHLEPERLKLVVAHLNHCLRGEDSDGDETFVSNLAAGYGLPFVSCRADVTALAKTSKISLEDAGRRARYSFLAETAAAHGAGSIAVAHHRDDQAETFLIRMLRGAGSAGLSGMAALSRGILKRPLLQVSREEVERYLRLRGLSYRTDGTNSDTSILRNSIRHELLPMLRRYNPKISERLAGTAEILAADQELLEQLTDEACRRLTKTSSEGVLLPVSPLRHEKRGLRLRLYRRALSVLKGDLQRISLNHLDAIDSLVLSDRPNARLDLPSGCVVARSYDDLAFTRERGVLPEWESVIDGEGRHQLPCGRTLLVERVPCPESLEGASRSVAFLDPDRAPFPWTVRSFLPGDRFTPLGMKGSQKIKDLFINNKLPLSERRRVPLLLSEGRVVCVVGLRMGEYAKLQGNAGSVLRVEILDITP